MTNLGVVEMAGATEHFMVNSRAGSADFDQGESAPHLNPSDRRRSGDGLYTEKRTSDLADISLRSVEDGATGFDDVDDEENKEVVAQLSLGAGQVWVPPPEDPEDYIEEEDEDEGLLVGEGGVGLSVVQNGLKNISECRLREKVGLLLRDKGIVSDVREEDNWQDVVTRLAMDAAKYIEPATAPTALAVGVASGSPDTGSSMDPQDYVKVKRLATGKKKDSWVVKGVACHKNVAHRRMASKDGISAPRILLLSGALEFSGSSKSLSSIDVVLDQEKAHLDKMLEHIAADRPDIMLVEKTVSGIAQDQLLEQNITLVQNVKYPLLESIARCTAAEIIPGIEDLAHVSLGRHGVLGLCQTFKVERFVEEYQPEKKSKTLMYFQGCPRQLGCTVVLCGAPLEELKQVKEVIKAAVFAAYHLRMECYFLMDEGATCVDIPPVSRPLSPGLTPDISGRSTPVGSPPMGACSPSSPRSPRSIVNRSPRSASSPQSPSSRLSARSPPPHNHSASIQQWQSRRCQSLSHRSWGSLDLRGQLMHATENSSILVSYSKRNKTTLHVCDKLQLRRIEYYGNNDRSLGSFLLDDLLNPDNKCKACEGPSEAHVQSFSHQLGSITVFASRVRENGEESMFQQQSGGRSMNAISSRDIGRSRDREISGHAHTRSWSKDKDPIPLMLGSSQREVGVSSQREVGGSYQWEGGNYSQREGEVADEGEVEEVEEDTENHFLPGQDLGQIWMWQVCLKCPRTNKGKLKKSKRVEMSEAARRLSFGRFLELSFSAAGANGYVMPCGHLVHRDCIRFFGVGVMRGGFCYSPLVLHDVKVPPIKLELSNPIEQEWLLMEVEDLEDRKRRSYEQLVKFLKDVRHHLAIMPLSHLTREADLHVKELESVLDANWLELQSEWTKCYSSGNEERAIPDIATLNHMRRILHVVVACWEQRLHCFATRAGISGFRAGVVRQEQRHLDLEEPYSSYWNNGPGQWEPMKAGELGPEVLGEGSICLSPAWTEPSSSGQVASLNKETVVNSIPASGETVLAESSSSESSITNGLPNPSAIDGQDLSDAATAVSLLQETGVMNVTVGRVFPSQIMVEMPDGSEGVAVSTSPVLGVPMILSGGEDGEELVVPECKIAPGDSEGCRLSSQSSLEDEVLLMVETMASPRNRGSDRAGKADGKQSSGLRTVPSTLRPQSDCYVVDLARMDEVWSGEKDKQRGSSLPEGEVNNGGRSPTHIGTRSDVHSFIVAGASPVISPGIPKPSPPRGHRDSCSSFTINVGSNAGSRADSSAVTPLTSPTKTAATLMTPVVISQLAQEDGKGSSELATKGLEPGDGCSAAAVTHSVDPFSSEVNVSITAGTLTPSGPEGHGSEEEVEGISPNVTSPSLPSLSTSVSASSSGVGAMIKNTLFPSPMHLQGGKKFSSAPNVLLGNSARVFSGGNVPSLAGIQDARGCARMLLPLRPEAPVVGVYEDEPTTVVAYALSSLNYAHKVHVKKLEKEQGKTGSGRERDRDRNSSRSREDFSLAFLQVKEADAAPVGVAAKSELLEAKANGADGSNAKVRESYGGIPPVRTDTGRPSKGSEGIEMTLMNSGGPSRRLSQGDALLSAALSSGLDSSQDPSVGPEWADSMILPSEGIEVAGPKESISGSKASSPKADQGRGGEEHRKESMSPPDTGRGGKAGTSQTGPGLGGSQFVDLDMLLWTEPMHVSTSFHDNAPQGKTDFSVTAYYAPQFEALRLGCLGGDNAFISSLSRSKKWQNIGGKSTVYFAKTQDERLIVKQLTNTELTSFVSFAPKYFKYLHDVLTSGNPTCLAKILGIYQVTIKPREGKQTKMDILVMENLLYGRQTKVIYDLKGSVRSRYNRQTDKDKVRVLLDENLLEDMTTSPIFVGGKAKRVLERAVWNDTSFLADLNVMDYSLLVGIDDDTKELVVGIIDYIRQYTWDKHLETWVKASGILGGPTNLPPTVISPGQYKQRFRKAMGTYFIAVPEDWTPNPAAAVPLAFEDRPTAPSDNREETEKASMVNREDADKACAATLEESDKDVAVNCEEITKAAMVTENPENAEKSSQLTELKISVGNTL